MLAPNSILRSRYRILQLIGKGGMGAVYEAIDQTFENVVAIKQMLVADDHLRKAFEREARLLNRLRHRALPVVTDYFFEGDGEFLVMQFIPGDDLGGLMKKRTAHEYPQGVPKPFDVPRVLNWAEQLLDALDYLHTQNPPILHRDIKPQNLKLNERGEIILLDFGLAKGATTEHTTAFTSIYGYTPSYAPLEQIQGAGTSTRSDLYSLAATLYNLLTGVTPADALSRATAAISGKPDPLHSPNKINAKVPAAIANVLMQALAQNPDQRPANAIAMRQALREAAQLAATEPPVQEKEKAERGNRIVVQIKPETVVEQKPEDKRSSPDKQRTEKPSKGVTQTDRADETQATIVRPKRNPQTVPNQPATVPDAEAPAKRKPKTPVNKPNLSSRRQEILDLLSEGYNDETIASRLALNVNDVREYLTKLRHDVGVITRKDLIVWAMTQSLKSHSPKETEPPKEKKVPPPPPPKEAFKDARKPVDPVGKQPPVIINPPPTIHPPKPPVIVDAQGRPPIPDASNLSNPTEQKPPTPTVENDVEHSAAGNFVGAILLGFFAIGAGMTLVRELEKSRVKTLGDFVGIIILGGLALALGIACLGAVMNFFAALKKK